ncbi:DUF416 family protein [Flavitalea flava]
MDKAKIEDMLLRIEAITPDTDDYGEYMGSYALNACVAISYSLQFLIDKDPIDIYHVGTCLTDTIDFKIQEENDNLTEEQIDNHPGIIETRNYLINETL